MRIISNNKEVNLPYELAAVYAEEGNKEGTYDVMAQIYNADYIMGNYPDKNSAIRRIDEMQATAEAGMPSYRFP